MSDHWLGHRVIVLNRKGTDFAQALSAAVSEKPSIEIAGIRLHCEEMFYSTLDRELVITHLSPFDAPPDPEMGAGRGRRRSFGKRDFLRAILEGHHGSV